MRLFQTKILIPIIILSSAFFQIQTPLASSKDWGTTYYVDATGGDPLASSKDWGTTYYVDATGGDDANNGTSPSSAWKTIAKVNSINFISDDSILFKRGEVWREKLRINQSGIATHPITFGAYGTGEKPLLLGSVTQNDPKDWIDLGNNLWATTNGSFPSDVGFILLGEESPVNIGTKCDYLMGIEDEVEEQHGYWYILNGVNEPKEYWHDFENQRVILYCHQNPALEYSNIEIAHSINKSHMIYGNGIHYVTIENLQLKYFDNHGMEFLWCSGITIRNCDISYGGGQYLIWNQKVRYGNGVEFIDGTKDCSVEYCKFSEIYDAAVTNQGGWGVGDQENILYSNNLIWNCHYTYECFDAPESSVIRNVYFTNNTCIGAGFGWSFKQRYDPKGWHIPLWGNTAVIEGVYIIGNVFYESRNSSIFHSEYKGVYGNIIFDYNTYYETVGKLYVYGNILPGNILDEIQSYEIQDYADYQEDIGQDSHSIFQNRTQAIDRARAIIDEKDHELLDELFNSTDILAQEFTEEEPASTTTSSAETSSTTASSVETSQSGGFNFYFIICIVIIAGLSLRTRLRNLNQEERKVD